MFQSSEAKAASVSEAEADEALPGLGFEPAEVYVLSELEQVRAATTPLRIQILDCLGPRPMTVREVGQELGISSTKLYYHVSELERVGLVRLVHTEVQSGIQQKFYRALAHYYLLSPDLLRGYRSADTVDASASFMTSQLDAAAEGLRSAFLTGEIDRASETFLLSRREVRLSPENARMLKQRMEELDRLARELDDPDEDHEVEFVMSVFPLGRTDQSGE